MYFTKIALLLLSACFVAAHPLDALYARRVEAAELDARSSLYGSGSPSHHHDNPPHHGSTFGDPRHHRRAEAAILDERATFSKRSLAADLDERASHYGHHGGPPGGFGDPRHHHRSEDDEDHEERMRLSRGIQDWLQKRRLDA